TEVTNVYNTTVIRNTGVSARVTYANQRVPSAVTAVSHDTFVNARPVARNLAPVNEKELAEATVSRDPGARPVRSSVMGAGAPAHAMPPARVVNRQVVATRTPTAPRAPFESREAARNTRPETPREAQTPREAMPVQPSENTRPAEPVT